MNPVNSGTSSASSPVRPSQPQSNNSSDKPVAEGSGEEDEAAVMQREAEKLVRKEEDLEEIAVLQAGRRPIASPTPEGPTDAEVLEHNTHSPPQPWCPHCTTAQGLRDPRRRIKKEVPDVDVALDKVPVISFDLMYL